MARPWKPSCASRAGATTSAAELLLCIFGPSTAAQMRRTSSCARVAALVLAQPCRRSAMSAPGSRAHLALHTGDVRDVGAERAELRAPLDRLLHAE